MAGLSGLNLRGVQGTGVRGLYQPKDPKEAASNTLAQASRTLASMSQKGTKTSETQAPGHTFGGGLMSAMGGAAAGASIASMATGAKMGSSLGWWGAGIGAGVGLLAYYMS